MIRLRVGNLIASNYSRFNLARIFGAELPSTQLESTSTKTGANGVQITTTTSLGGSSLSIPALKQGQRFYPSPGKTYIAGPGIEFTPDEYPNSTLLEIDEGPAASSLSDPNATIKVKFVEYTVKEDGGPQPQPEMLNKLKAAIGAKKVASIFSEPKTIFTVKAVDVLSYMTATTRKSIDGSKVSTEETEYGTKVNQFMDVENNAIARSFRSAGGQGLAGFIDSLSYDWFNSTTWDTDSGRKAPKMCKVTISFTPIHDITPGLDSLGYNRAPVYPVGVNKRNFGV